MTLDAKRARGLLLALITACLGFASVWLVRVPIFGEPDERTHVDYALAIWSAGRPIAAGDHPTATSVAPQTEALAHAGDFDTVRLDPDGRVERGYGSAAYFARVDRTAPRERGWYAHASAVPYIAASYPFGFYALAALGFGITNAATHSLIAGFFAMRLLCLAMLAGVLYLVYAIAREMRLSRTLALAVVAAIGLFHTVAYTFAYVQPDDLAMLLVQAIVLMTLRVRRLGPTWPRTLVLAGALAALSVVKLHTAIALLAAIGFPLGFTLSRAHLGSARVARRVATLAVPMLLAIIYAAQLERHGPTMHDYAHFTTRLSAEPLGALARDGVAVALPSIVSIYAGAVRFEYEHDFSIQLTPVSFGSAGADAAVDTALRIGTLAVLIAVLARVAHAVRVAMRIARLRHSRGRALELLTHDVVWNAYVCYVAMLIAAEVYVDGAVRLQGRYLVPAIVGATLCAVRYAPRALPARFRRPTAAVAATLLVSYSLADAALGLGAIDARYYRPAPASAPSEWGVAVERFAAADDRAKVARCFIGGTRIEAAGWSVDSHRTRPAPLHALLDGRTTLAVENELPSQDAVDRLNDDRLGRAGFRFFVDTRGLHDGLHTLTLSVIERGRAIPYAGEPPRFFVRTAGASGCLTG